MPGLCSPIQAATKLAYCRPGGIRRFQCCNGMSPPPLTLTLLLTRSPAHPSLSLVLRAPGHNQRPLRAPPPSLSRKRHSGVSWRNAPAAERIQTQSMPLRVGWLGTATAQDSEP